MEKGLLVLLSILILSVIFIAAPTELTGFATYDTASIDLQTSSSKTAVNEPIEGNIVLNLNENIDPQEPITLTLNDQTYSYTLQQILDLTNLTYEYESSEFNATNEAQQKSLTFTNADSQYLGFKLPRYSEVSNIQFTLTATNNPKSLTMDFGSEGTTDWSFLGNFQGFNTNSITSEDFDGTQESTGQILDNQTFYCEFFTLPKTKDINISTTFTKKSTSGNISAIILSVPTGNPKVGWSGGSNYCDIPENKNSCTINLEYPIEGKYLICIYSQGSYNEGETLYEIPLDTSSETDSAYTCPTEEEGICQSTTFSNFFIYTQTGNYNDTLSGNINLQEWETFQDSILTGIKYYIGSEPYNGICKSTMCNIPINITSSSTGDLLFKDLSLTYTYNGITQTSNTFYDLTVPQTNIYIIENEELSKGTTITIPLNKLNIIPTAIGDYNLTAQFSTKSDSQIISVRESSQVYDSKTLIALAQEKYLAFSDKTTDEYRILSMLDKIQKIEQTDLDAFKDQIGFTDESTLLSNVESSISNLPWEITFSQTTSDLLVLEPQDIPSSLGDIESIYKMQEAVSIKTTLKTVEIKNYNEETSTYYLLHKQITANEDITDAKLYEIPISQYYTVRPTSTSGTTATYDFSLTKGNTQDYYYLTSESIELNDIKTILVLNEISIITPNIYTCGDNICTIPYETENSCPNDCTKKYPWAIIIIIISIALLIILFILYKKKN